MLVIFDVIVPVAVILPGLSIFQLYGDFRAANGEKVGPAI